MEYPKLGSDPSCVAIYLGLTDFNNYFRLFVKKILMTALGFLSALCPHRIIFHELFYLFSSLYFTCQESCSNMSLTEFLNYLLVEGPRSELKPVLLNQVLISQGQCHIVQKHHLLPLGNI